MKRILIGSLAVVLVGLVAFAGWRWIPIRHVFYTDAETIRTPASSANPREILWEPPRLLPPMINAGGDVYEPRLSGDGLTMFFVRGKAGENAEIFVSRYSFAGWGEPEAVIEVNSPYEDLGPEPSADGKALYLYSDRPGGLGGYDLWVAHRRSDGRSDTEWHEPVNLGPSVNSSFNDYGLALTPDGSVLYFSSNRPLPTDFRQPNPDAWPATLREDLFRRTYDLYAASVSVAGVGEAEPLVVLNTSFNEGAPAVSAFGDFLYFSSDRPGGAGAFDLYRSRRLRGGHQLVESLGLTVNTEANELDPGLSLGGYRLYFSSDRLVDQAAVERPLEYRLYQTSSREVFRETEREDRLPIDWAALWSAIGPSLLWLLLAVLLLLLLLALLRSLSERRMSLLAKCLLASLLAHVLLMLLLTVWEVTAGIAGEFRRGGAIRVALTSSGAASDLTAQIRGPVTPFDVSVAAKSPQAPRHEEFPTKIPDEPLKLVPIERKELRFADQPAVMPVMTDSMTPLHLKPRLLERSWDVPAEAEAVIVAMPPLPKRQQVFEALEITPISPGLARPSRPEVSPWPNTGGPVAAVRLPIETKVSSALDDLSVVASPVEFREARSETITAPHGVGLQLPETPRRVLSNEIMLSAMREPKPSGAAEQTPAMPSSTPVTSHSRAGVLPQLHFDSATPKTTELRPERMSMPMDRSAASGEWLSGVTDAAPLERLELRGTPIAVSANVPSPTVLELGLESPAERRIPTNESELNEAREAEEFINPVFGVEEAVRRMPASQAEAFVNNSTVSNSPVVTWVELKAHEPRRARPSDGMEPSLAHQVSMAPSASHAVSELPPLPAERPNFDSRTSYLRPSLDVKFPTEELAPESPYVQRTAPDRLDFVERSGGSEETENAVDLALNWLARHQSIDGHWDADGFDEGCGECDGTTEIGADIALTGLSTLCFLGAGHTHVRDGDYRENVERALQWLVRQQKPDGDLRGSETMYTQGIATIALSEAYAMTDDSRLGQAVEKSVRFIYRARNREDGGWRYDPKQAGDTSVLGWQVMALKSASMAGIAVPREAFETARRWLDRVSSPSRPGLYAYIPGRPFTPSMTAEGMFVQQMLGAPRESTRMRGSVEFILQHLPDWETDPNTYFWYYAALALYQYQGDAWERWNEALTRELLEHQRKDGKAAGSWDPVGEWAKLGGRVYQTAFCALMLEVYYRYLPLYALDETPVAASVPDAIGTVHGSITDAHTAEPIEGATVRLNLSDREAITATTNRHGDYELFVPEVPDFFAISASHEGYVPASTNVEAAKLGGRGITINFELRQGRKEVIVTEADPELHHLGDNRFDGTINSQFQKASEGSSYRTEFPVSAEQLPPRYRRAEARMLVKGVQRRHGIHINETRLSQRLDDAPEDGSFGEFRASFDATLLREGANSIAIVAAPSEVDIDDFEFVNVQIHLIP